MKNKATAVMVAALLVGVPYSAMALIKARPAENVAPAPSSTPASSVRVALGDITDSRTTGQFFKNLKVEMKLSGDAVFDAFGITNPDFTTATDDTGRSLLKDEKDKKKETLLWTFQPRNNKADTENVSAELNNPARKATTFTLKGSLAVYNPKADANAVITVNNLPAMYGKLVESDALKQAGITLMVLDKDKADAAEKARQEEERKKSNVDPKEAMGKALGQMFGMGGSLDEKTVQYLINDPQNKLVYIEMLGADGVALHSNSRMHITRDDMEVYTYSYEKPIAAATALKVYIATPASFISVPVNFENTPLP